MGLTTSLIGSGATATTVTSITVTKDGEIDEEAFFRREPVSVFRPAVFDVHVDVPDPVHVGLGGKGGVDGLDGELLRIDLHLPVQDGIQLRRRDILRSACHCRDGRKKNTHAHTEQECL